jgi:hypothetical protein
MTDDREFRDTGELTTADLADPVREAKSGEPQQPPPAPDTQRAEPPESQREPLFPAEDAEQLRERWSAIQAGFVDEPRRAVEEADGLVAAAIKRVAETFANERSNLEAQWDRGGDVETEDLRIALRRYRSFFDRILSM